MRCSPSVIHMVIHETWDPWSYPKFTKSSYPSRKRHIAKVQSARPARTSPWEPWQVLQCPSSSSEKCILQSQWHLQCLKAQTYKSTSCHSETSLLAPSSSSWHGKTLPSTEEPSQKMDKNGKIKTHRIEWKPKKKKGGTTVYITYCKKYPWSWFISLCTFLYVKTGNFSLHAENHFTLATYGRRPHSLLVLLRQSTWDTLEPLVATSGISCCSFLSCLRSRKLPIKKSTLVDLTEFGDSMQLDTWHHHVCPWTKE